LRIPFFFFSFDELSFVPLLSPELELDVELAVSEF
jgi:hypothetical protein